MGAMASQITSLTSVYSTGYSGTDHRWIPRTDGQKRGKCFLLMTSWCNHCFMCKNTYPYPSFNGGLVKSPLKLGHGWVNTSYCFMRMELFIHVLNSMVGWVMRAHPRWRYLLVNELGHHYSGRHRAGARRNANSALVLPDVSQSLALRVVCSVLNDDHCRYKKMHCSRKIKIS